MSKITDDIRLLTEPIVRENGCTLWDVEYVKEAGSWYLRLYIDKDGKLILRGSIDKAGVFGKSMKWTRVPDSEKSRFTPLKKSELRKFN